MKFLKPLKFLLLFLILCLLLFVVVFFTDKFFLIKKIELISDKRFDMSNKDQLINKSLIFIDKSKVARDIVQKNSYIKTAVVEKVWPATLKITVAFYNPTAALIVNKGFFDLSSDGRILIKNNENKQALPTINFYQKLNNNFYQTGDWIEYKDIIQALFFIEKLNQINLIPLTIDIGGEDMLVFKLDKGKKIIFSVRKDKEEQDYILETIVRQFKIQGKEFQGIDLRFNKPIISF